MKNLQRKNGFTIGSVLFWAVIVIVSVLYGGQIGMAYIEKQTMKNAVQSALQDTKKNENAGIKEVRSNIKNRMSINTTEIADDEMTIKKITNGFEVTVDKSKDIKITDRIKIVVDLTFTEASSKGKEE